MISLLEVRRRPTALRDRRLTVMTESPFAGTAGALAGEMIDLPDVGACVASLDALRG